MTLINFTGDRQTNKQTAQQTNKQKDITIA